MPKSLRALALALLVASIGAWSPPPQAPPPRYRMVPQLGHTGFVHAVALSRDGRTLATTGGDGLLKLWDARARLVVRSFAAHDGAAGQVAFLPDGTLATTPGGDDSTTQVVDKGPLLKLWSAQGTLLRTFGARASASASPALFAVAADGKRAVTATLIGGGTRLQVWDVATAREVAAWTWSPIVFAVAISPDGATVATGDETGFVRLRVVAGNGQPEPMAIPHPKGEREPNLVTTLAFSPNGAEIFSGDKMGYVARWDVAKRAPIKTCRRHIKSWSAVAALWPSPNPSEVRVVEKGGVFTLDATTCSWTGDDDQDMPVMYGAAFSADGAVVAYHGGDAASVGPWRGRMETVDGSTPERAQIGGLSFVHGALLARQDDRVRVWDLESLAPRRTIERTRGWLDDGRILAERPAVELRGWDGAHVGDAALPLGTSAIVATSDDGRRVLVTFALPKRASDRERVAVGIVDAASGSLARLQAPDGTFVEDADGDSLAMSSDGTRVLATRAYRYVFTDGEGRPVAEWPPLRAATDVTSYATLVPTGDRFLETSEASLSVREVATGRTVVAWKPYDHGLPLPVASHDGRRVATWCNDAEGIAVWDLATGGIVKRLPGGGRDVWRLALDASGHRLAIVGDKETRVVDVDSGADVARVPFGRDDAVFSPDGARLSIAGHVVELGGGATKDLPEGCAVGAVRLACPAASWTALVDENDHRVGGAVGLPTEGLDDGKFYVERGGRRFVRPEGPGEIIHIAMSANLERLATAGVVGGTDVGAVTIWEPEKGASWRRLGGDDLPPAIDVAITPDGKRVVSSHMFAHDRQRGELRLWDSDSGALLRTIPMSAPASDVTISRDGTRALTGSLAEGAAGNVVRAWDLATGRALGELAHPGDVVALALSDDGALAATGTKEGIVRVFRPDAPASAVALVARDDEWLAYTDDGYFDSSIGGASLVAAADDDAAYRIDQLAAWYDRPDLVLERLGIAPPDLVAHFAARHARRLRELHLSPDADVRSTKAPEAAIEKVERDGRRATVTFVVKSSGAPLERYSIWDNDVPIWGPLGKETSGQEQRLTETIDLVSGDNRIEVSGTDANGLESLHPVTTVRLDEHPRGDLWFLGIGVSRYADPKLDLVYPRKDVKDLADVLAHAPGFDHVHVKTLLDEEVTVAGVRAAKSFLRDAGVEDTVVVAIAGHGVHARDAEAEYYFATHEVVPSRLAETAAPFSVIDDLVQGILPRRKLVLIDTCESGDVDDDMPPPVPAPGLTARSSRGFVLSAPAPARGLPPRRVVASRDRFIYDDLARRSGAVVVASSRGDESSWELESLHNGVFTKSVLWALTGRAADEDQDGTVSARELVRFVGQSVAERTGDRQHPTFDRDNPTAAIALPIVRDPAALAVLTRADPFASSSPSSPSRRASAPTRAPLPKACGCRVVGTGAPAWWIAALGALAAVAAWRRRRA